MFHLVARGIPKSVLFYTWEEGLTLFDTLVRHVPNIVAMCVMPDHIHVQCPTESHRPFGLALRSYARMRNRKRGHSGPVFERSPEPQYLATRDKIRRSERYIHLNPCRAHLVQDPLEWPLSTYRDAVGLIAIPARRMAADPVRTHAYVSADPTVAVHGTELPFTPVNTPTLHDIYDAVGGLYRAPTAAFHQKGPIRSLFLQAARALTTASTQDIAAYIGLSPRAVRNASDRVDDRVRLVARVCGDHRFSTLRPGDLRQTPTWARWRNRF